MAADRMTQKLNVFGHNNTSQHGEDGIIQYILQHIPPPPRVCVEFGAWDGKFLSNTYSLWHDQGWHAILAEADQDRAGALRRDYTATHDVRVHHQFITPKGENSVDALFRREGIDPDIGLISIDIDSCDYHVWKNMEYVSSHIVVIEHNHTIPGYVDYHDPEDEVFLRCSAKSLEALGREKGYRLVCCTLTNSIFVKNAICDNRYLPDMPVEFLFDYSACYPAKLSANIGTTKNNVVDVFVGPPRKAQRFCGHLTKGLAIVTRRTYSRPSRSVLEACNRAGITVF